MAFGPIEFMTSQRRQIMKKEIITNVMMKAKERRCVGG